MKKTVSVLLNLVFIFVLGLAAVACSDDDKTVDPPEITGIYAEGVENAVRRRGARHTGAQYAKRRRHLLLFGQGNMEHGEHAVHFA